MKSLNTVFALIIGATLITAGTGCKKSPKPPTLIPGTRGGGIADGSSVSRPFTLPGPNTPGGGTIPGGGNLPPSTGLEGTGAGTSTSLPPVGGEIQTVRPQGERNEQILKAETVYFDLDRATVKASERPKLDNVATYLKNNPTHALLVEGNCDERGTEDYNRSLGERRALSAREYLVNSGIAPERVTTVTYGEDKPADPGHDESAWSKNRRADFVVLGGAVTTGTQ